jgi:4-amino-4-deoxy-L-arabinose transferase-like glycosyltransferase
MEGRSMEPTLKGRMKSIARLTAALLATLAVLLLAHWPLLRLPYFWDEAGYYIPAAFDFYRHWLLIPASTEPVGHTPLLPVFLGIAWRVFGFSPLVTRAAMILIAAATVAATYALARRFVRQESAAWVALLLAVSPLFFAQSSLANLDLTVALFVTLAVLALLGRKWAWFAVAASLAILTKETAVILLPIAWLYSWRGEGTSKLPEWLWLGSPLVPLILWTIYYHHSTGFWTGNSQYLDYNLYSALDPARIMASFVRRIYEAFVGGFNWVLIAGAAAGWWWSKKSRRQPAREQGRLDRNTLRAPMTRQLSFMVFGLTAIYILFHSFVGGAVLPRYLLPIFPVLYLAFVIRIESLPRWAARAILAAAATCFIASWFINPPYPYPFEDNLAYATFVRLHVQAADFLKHQPGQPRILTAWPATDELSKPYLGYVGQPLRLVKISGFDAQDFRKISPGSFDILYLYSRKWDPPGNWIRRFPLYRSTIERLFDYAPAVPDETLEKKYGLRRLANYEQNGQWVRIYAR